MSTLLHSSHETCCDDDDDVMMITSGENPQYSLPQLTNMPGYYLKSLFGADVASFGVLSSCIAERQSKEKTALPRWALICGTTLQ